MGVQQNAFIPPGSRVLQVILNLKKPGTAVLKMQVGDTVTRLPITIGTTVEKPGYGVGATPLGLAIAAPGTAGRIFMKPGAQTRFRVHLFRDPANEDIPVTIHSRHSGIVEATADMTAIPQGKRALDITLTTNPGATGTAIIDLTSGDVSKTIEVVVSESLEKYAPITVSPVVGFELKE